MNRLSRFGGRPGPSYDTFEACLNGHAITARYHSSPQLRKPFCPKCGAKTIHQCPHCNNDIQGQYLSPNVISLGGPGKPPAFCMHCGSPFPWTESSLKAADAFADTLDTLSEVDKKSLKEALPELVRDTPMTKVAESKFKTIMKKVTSDAYEGMKSILTDVASETIKKSLFG